MIHLVKSITWLLLTIFFGLLQLWIKLGSSYARNETGLTYSDIILNGLFLFFASAVVSSITIDYYFNEKVEFTKYTTGFLFVLYPGIIIITCIWLFSTCSGEDLAKLNFEFINSINIAVMVMTCLYIAISKTLIYAND